MSNVGKKKNREKYSLIKPAKYLHVIKLQFSQLSHP